MTEKLGEIVKLAAIILIIWVGFNVVDGKHNPHHSLEKAVHLIWDGYR